MVAAPALTVNNGLVSDGFAGCVTSLAVIVKVPAVFIVTATVLDPELRAPFAGIVVFGSVEVNEVVSVTVVTRFQFVSTARMVTLKAVPAVCGLGVPVFPVAVPGAAISPGSSSCSLANGPAFTVMDALVFAVFVLSVASLAVIV